MADKRFQLTFDVNANINPIKGAIGELKGSLGNLKIPDTFKKSIESTVASLEKEITNFESIASKGFLNMGDFNKANRSFEKISDLFNKLGVQVKNLKGVDPNKFLPAETLKKTQSLQQAWLKLKQTVDKGVSTEGIEKATQALEKQKQKLEELQATEKKYREQQQSEIKRRDELQEKLGDKDTKNSLLYDQKNLTKRVREAELSGNTKNNTTYTNNKKALEDLNKTISSYRAEITAAEQKIADFDTKIIGATADVEKQSIKVDNLTKDLEELKNASQKAPEGIKQFIEDLKTLDGIDTKAIDDAGEDLEKLQQILTNYQAGKAKEIADGISKVGENAEKLDQPVSEAAEELHKFGDECSYADDKSRELENLANQVKQFFSIGNTVQLFKRAIRSAFDTIKELDAVMTQTAVVTDFTVGDMWAQLPEYTKRANELGVSVKGAYEAATLYYQQGLSTNEVIGVSNETLKMAKIAAIDYATATDYMTSALRGFNMEVNEQSAKKVNDIYSQLAAKTAADTEEISIAMSKTAPLAHNAGMEIETTAAFLAQAIETTREAPETIGTAMKTVIARFQELKKDPALIEPVEGEIVDANKIEGALRTIGVALRDTNGQFRDLDDVFLEISQKWNSLDTNTQRYIATIAAGSRQQSRFIAMMANYDRTMELVEMANTSAGASQQQFEKTLDSMQSKLDRLKNAWNEFTMGLANNSVIKAVVDLLTDLLNTINKISSGVSGNNGILKSLVDIGVLMGGLKLGKAAFTGFFGWLQGKSKVVGGKAGGNLLKGFFNKKALLGGLNTTKGILIRQLASWGTGSSSLGQIFKYWGLKKGGLGSGLGTLFLQLGSGASIKQIFKYWTTGLNPLTAKFKELQIIGTGAGKAIVKAFSLLPGPLKIALPLVIALGAAIIKVAKDNSIEERIKKAEESTKQATKAAEQAQEAYDNLLGGRTKYSELQTTLDNLTYGTTAWKEALIEANGQVLQLLQTYPQLTQYLTSGANGRLQISEEGWDIIVKQQEDAIRRTTNSLIGSQIYKSNLDNEKLFRDLQSKLGLKNRPEFLNELIDLYKTNPIAFTKDENGEYRQELLDFVSIEGANILKKADPEKVIEAADAIGEYLLAVQENGVLIDSYVDNLINTNAKFSGLTDEETNALKESYKGKISENYNAQINDVVTKIIGRTGKGTEASTIDFTYLNDLLKKYELEIGTNHKENLQTLYKYLAGITGEEIDEEVLKSEEAMAEAIARMEFGDEIEASINKVAQKLKTDTTGGIQKILNVLGGEIGDFTMQDLDTFKQVFDENSTIEKAAKSLNMSKKDLEDIIIDMGYSIRDASGELVADFESFRQDFFNGTVELGEAIQQARINIVTKLHETGYNEADIRSLVSPGRSGRQLTEAQQLGLSSFMDKTSFLDSNIRQDLWVDVLENLKMGTQETAKETLDLINNIDFSNTIDSLLALEDAAENGTEETKKLAQSILEVSSEQLNAGKVFQNFAMSDEYSKLEESIQDVVKTNGKLSSANIKDLAKQCSTLDKMLKLDKVSASGLAKALTAVAEGRIGIEEINSAILRALSSTKSLEDAYLELQQFFNEVDEGYDDTQFTKKYKEYANNLLEWSEAGLRGTDQFKKQTDLLLGEGTWEKYAQQGEAGMSQLMGVVSQWNNWLADNGVGFWSMLAQDAEQNLPSIKFFVDETGSIAFQFKEGFSGNLEDIINEVAEFKNIPKELAESLVLSYAATSVEFQNELSLAEARAQYSSFIKELDKGNDKTVVTRNQLELFAKALGTTYEELKSKLESDYKDSIVIADWIDPETGARKKGEELWEAVMAAYGYGSSEELETGMGITQRTGHAIDIDETGKKTSVEVQEKVWNYEVAIKYAEDNDLTKEDLDDFAKNHNVTFTSEFGDGGTIEEIEGKIEAANSQAAEDLQSKEQDAINSLDFSTIQSSVATNVNKGILSGGKAAISPLAAAIANTAFTGTVKLDAIVDGEYVNGTRIRTSGVDNGKDFANTYHPTGSGGRYTKNFASGTEYGGLKHSQIALTGEEGYELAYNSHGAFLLGENGPEVAKLEKGTVIYPHKLSKKILNGYSKSIFPNYKTGTIPNYYNAGSGLGTSTMKVVNFTTFSEAASNFDSLTSSMKEAAETAEDITEETEKWENEVDWLYNMTQKINQELRVRNKLEKQYNRALKTNTGTAEDLRRLTNQEIVSLKKRQDMQKEMIELRKKELHTYMMLNKEMMKYAIIDNWDDMTIHIAWDSINNITDKDEYDKAVDFLNKLEDFQKQIYDLEDDIEDIEDELIELKERGKDEYRDLEDRVLDALISEQQKIIDNQEKEIKAISNAEKDLVDAIQKNIDKMRQDRDNEEKESSLAEKERRLAYLRQDTTGSNALEIKQLEKELEKEKQDYTDTLIDQAIKDMKEQADKASEQREKQIELLQEQLEWQKETGYWADEATRIVREGINSNDLYNTEMYRLLYEADGVGAMSNASKDWWKEELEKTVKEAYIYLNNVLEPSGSGGDIVETMKQNSLKWWTASTSEQNQLHSQNEQLAKEYEAATGEKLTYKNGGWYRENGEQLYKLDNDSIASSIVTKMKQNSKAWPNADDATKKKLEAENDELAKRLGQRLGKSINKKNGVWYIDGQELYSKYEKGGLADFTGPAWLDGTKSKPEMVLNAKDTENFIQLKDILSNLRSGIVGRSTQGGDWYFDIDINVDEIANDYDVDKVAARIKQSIYEETAYRNVNAINFLK